MATNANPTNIVRGTLGDDDLQARGTGSLVLGSGGDDILRGRSGNDVLIGGPGDDQMYGGRGADEFRFDANQIQGGSDTDRIYDLTFSEGDVLVFNNFGGIFQDDAGINATATGNGAIIYSFEGLFNAVSNAGARASFTGSTAMDLLFVTFIAADGDSQTIRISNGYAAFLAAGGTANA